MENEKIFFLPGDVVQIKQSVDYKPKMVVKGKDQKMIKTGDDKKGVLKGIICFWFTKDGHYQEAVFSTKDIQLVE